MKYRIYVIEDDENIRNLICVALENFGYCASGFETAEEALDNLSALLRRGREAQREYPAMFVFDWMLPGMDGFALTKAIRESGSMLPILMLTAKDMPQDKHTGFIVGTDDYMTKPPDRQELVLRIKALLRRARIVDEHRITIGDVELDYDTHTVRRGHDAQVLPPKEFNLLYKLLAYPERTFTRLELLDEIWGMDSESDDKTVNVHINRLRTRFYDWPEFEIQTIRGIGYRAIKKV